jgi:hypothetical protein
MKNYTGRLKLENDILHQCIEGRGDIDDDEVMPHHGIRGDSTALFALPAWSCESRDLHVHLDPVSL